MPNWPKHPCAGKRAIVLGPGKLRDGRVLSDYLEIMVPGEPISRTMHKADLIIDDHQ